MIQALRQGKHEIATSTYSDMPDPTLEEIQRAKTYLNEECGVPLDEMKGFRAPGLTYSQSTLDMLQAEGFLYDASMAMDDHLLSNFGRNHYWPFTLNHEVPFTCTCEPTKPNPGLWEIPLTRHYNDRNVPYTPQDITGPQGTDIFADLTRSLEKHYNGNRAPMGVHFHLAWLLENSFSFKDWILPCSCHL